MTGDSVDRQCQCIVVLSLFSTRDRHSTCALLLAFTKQYLARPVRACVDFISALLRLLTYVD
jgi:hypothetical protein